MGSVHNQKIIESMKKKCTAFSGDQSINLLCEQKIYRGPK